MLVICCLTFGLWKIPVCIRMENKKNIYISTGEWIKNWPVMGKASRVWLELSGKLTLNNAQSPDNINCVKKCQENCRPLTS